MLSSLIPEAILSQRQNRYLVRQLCWVLTIEGGFVSQQSLGKAIPVKYRVENPSPGPPAVRTHDATANRVAPRGAVSSS